MPRALKASSPKALVLPGPVAARPAPGHFVCCPPSERSVCYVGLLAKLVTPGRNPAGYFGTAVIGIAGALLGTANGHAWGWYYAGETAGLVGALIGAILVVSSFYVIRRNPASRILADVAPD